jgi:hypothetical protein
MKCTGNSQIDFELERFRCKAGRLGEGFAVITKAFALAGQTGEGYVLPELHRIKGELFMKNNELSQAGRPLNDSRSTALSQAQEPGSPVPRTCTPLAHFPRL